MPIWIKPSLSKFGMKKNYLLLYTMFLIVILVSINFSNAYGTWTKLEIPKVNMNVEVKAWCKDCGGAAVSLTVKYEDNITESRGCDFWEYVSWQANYVIKQELHHQVKESWNIPLPVKCIVRQESRLNIIAVAQIFLAELLFLIIKHTLWISYITEIL